MSGDLAPRTRRGHCSQGGWSSWELAGAQDGDGSEDRSGEDRTGCERSGPEMGGPGRGDLEGRALGTSRRKKQEEDQG